MSTQVNTNGSVFMSLLAVLFIGLKLTGYITWSWWYVTLPIWGPLALGAIILSIMALLLSTLK